jgi:hypothetical protein
MIRVYTETLEESTKNKTTKISEIHTVAGYKISHISVCEHVEFKTKTKVPFTITSKEIKQFSINLTICTGFGY